MNCVCKWGGSLIEVFVPSLLLSLSPCIMYIMRIMYIIITIIIIMYGKGGRERGGGGGNDETRLKQMVRLRVE